jgi:hypothetical protein
MSEAPKQIKHSVDDGIGCLVGFAAAVAAVWWIGFSFFYAPSHALPDSEVGVPVEGDMRDVTDRELAVLRAFAQSGFFVGETELPRLELMKGSNLDIFLEKRLFERVPYPDRKGFVEAVGTAWCSRVEWTYLPRVRFRDIKSGRGFGTYGCFSNQVGLAW